MKNGKGRLIILEGVDGAGKTTQAEILQKRLGGHEAGVLHIAEPGGSPMGQSIREILLNSSFVFTAEEMLLAFTWQRTHLVQNLIIPAIASGHTIISDRSIVSTLVYQVQAGCTVERVLDVSREIIKLLSNIRVDVFILDVSAKVARERAMHFSRSHTVGTVNHFDEASLAVYEERRKLYLDCPRMLGWWASHVLDGEQPIGTVADEIFEYVTREQVLTA